MMVWNKLLLPKVIWNPLLILVGHAEGCAINKHYGYDVSAGHYALLMSLDDSKHIADAVNSNLMQLGYKPI